MTDDILTLAHTYAARAEHLRVLGDPKYWALADLAEAVINLTAERDSARDAALRRQRSMLNWNVCPDCLALTARAEAAERERDEARTAIKERKR